MEKKFLTRIEVVFEGLTEKGEDRRDLPPGGTFCTGGVWTQGAREESVLVTSPLRFMSWRKSTPKSKLPFITLKRKLRLLLRPSDSPTHFFTGTKRIIEQEGGAPLRLGHSTGVLGFSGRGGSRSCAS